jgi:hypothetical protein
MKQPKLWIFVLILSGMIAFAAETRNGAPGVRSSAEVVQAPILKVYTAVDGKHRFVAYLVKWKNSEVIVSDPLSQSNYKVGDKISFLAQRTSVEKPGGGTIDTLSFTLSRPPAK